MSQASQETEACVLQVSQGTTEFLDSGDEWEENYWKSREEFAHSSDGLGFESEVSFESDELVDRNSAYESDADDWELRPVYGADRTPTCNMVPVQANGTHTPWNAGLNKGKGVSESNAKKGKLEKVVGDREAPIPPINSSISTKSTSSKIDIPEVASPEVPVKKILRRDNLPLPSSSKDVEMEELPVRSNAPPEPKPIDVREVQFRTPRDIPREEEVQHTSKSPPAKNLKRRRPGLTKDDGNTERVHSRRRSELSSQIDSRTVVSKIMNTQIIRPMKDILGTSGEICRIMTDLIKLKNPKVLSVEGLTRRNALEHILKSLTAAQASHTAGDGRLIRLQLRSNGLTFYGILDTGSEFNILYQ
ncbi:hypothetical protein BDP27DRAFT_1451940 [Rhodocollybia butyracea]|uniref:Uncharacterized protein n=1 Tax=Rhodocollybia butyracea TaxID=206335 RepID=A0A9P5U152_9AGAR|nr:hypothetical protein BDP27DRAFT_1451940 [Rhodocollybia butyracea]